MFPVAFGQIVVRSFSPAIGASNAATSITGGGEAGVAAATGVGVASNTADI